MFDRQNDRWHVAFDIETTGFGYEESVTVVGFWFPGCHSTLLLNAHSLQEVECELLQIAVREQSDLADVSVKICDGDSDVLEAVCETMYDAFDREYNRLVVFNAESWKGGFDLPFLRTLCIKSDTP